MPQRKEGHYFKVAPLGPTLCPNVGVHAHLTAPQRGV